MYSRILQTTSLKLRVTLRAISPFSPTCTIAMPKNKAITIICIIAIELTGARMLLGNISTICSITDRRGVSTTSATALALMWMVGITPLRRLGTTNPNVTAKRVVVMK